MAQINRFEDIEAKNSQESGVETPDSGLPTGFIDYGPGDSCTTNDETANG